MIQQLNITLPDGVTPSQVPYIEYELSPTESVGVIGIDYNKYPSNPIPEHPEIKYTTPGKLQSEPLAAQEVIYIQNSLRRDGWDFEKYPDPEIVVIKQKTVEEVLASTYPINEKHITEDDTITLFNSWIFESKNHSTYPGAKTIWREVPTWESIIGALITWSKTHQVPFVVILSDAIFYQTLGEGMFYHIPKQIREWAYDKFRASFNLVLVSDLYKTDEDSN